jgi:hypothetical protein
MDTKLRSKFKKITFIINRGKFLKGELYYIYVKEGKKATKVLKLYSNFEVDVLTEYEERITIPVKKLKPGMSIFFIKEFE